MNIESHEQTASFADLLSRAISEPGQIHSAYFAFHGYSLGNQFLAMIQCAERGIAIGPIASFNKWKDRGRFVQRGQKAIQLWMPITAKHTTEATATTPEQTATFTRFVLRPNWFVLAQTQGAEYTPEPIPGWDRTRALATLEITEIPFDHTDGNVWGFARAKEIAISPLSPLPDRTLLHEVAHVVLGHTTEAIELDGAHTPRNLREVEAEGVALLCSAALALDGAEYSRGYLQHWLQGGEIPERSCQRMFKAADTILRAGRESVEEGL
jgi:hypothetical protein